MRTKESVIAVMAVAILTPILVSGCDDQHPDPNETVRALPAAPAEERERARTVLDLLAEKAASQPHELVADDQLIYVDSAESVLGEESRHEIWLDPNGLASRRIVRSGAGDNDFVRPKSGQWIADDDEHIARFYAQMAEQGPSPSKPTRDWLRKLPEDPEQLYLVLKNKMDSLPSESTGSITEAFRSLLTRAWPMIEPSQRASIYKAIGYMPSAGAASAEPILVGGRSVYSVFLVKEPGHRVEELLFDAETGLCVGSRGGPANWSFWTVSVVDRWAVGDKDTRRQ